MKAAQEIVGPKIRSLRYYLCWSFPSINSPNPRSEARTMKTQRGWLTQRVTANEYNESTLAHTSCYNHML